MCSVGRYLQPQLPLSYTLKRARSFSGDGGKENRAASYEGILNLNSSFCHEQFALCLRDIKIGTTYEHVMSYDLYNVPGMAKTSIKTA